MNVGSIGRLFEYYRIRKAIRRYAKSDPIELQDFNRKNLEIGDIVYVMFNTTDGIVAYKEIVEKLHINIVKFEGNDHNTSCYTRIIKL